jgi:tetraacyldisaccharide 4'-kinase
VGWLVGSLTSVSRELHAAPGTKVVAIGGATIGGSGRTALVLSCAEYMHEQGASVAIVGHAYRASPPLVPHVVSPEDPLAGVGDEARMLARALGGKVKVVVARHRQVALQHACTLADVVILDGVLQTHPRRATLSVLALRDDTPWGSERVLPAGDLRARPSALLAACDLQARVHVPLGAACHALAGKHVGLITSIARPDRIVRALTAAGLHVATHLDLGDHGSLARRTLVRALWAAPSVEAWVATPKCAEHLLPHADFLASHGSPIVELEARAKLEPRLISALDAIRMAKAPHAAPT